MGGILPCGCLVLNWMLLKRRTGRGEREQGAGNGKGERETGNGEQETTTPKLCALLL